MSSLQMLGFTVSLLVFAPSGDFLRHHKRSRWREQRQYFEKELRLRLYRFPSLPSRIRSIFIDVMMLKFWLQLNCKNADRYILHCRSEIATMIAVRAAKRDPRARVIFDCRGLSAAQYLYENGFETLRAAPKAVRDVATWWDNCQRSAAKDCDAMLCVSEAMRQEVASLWAIEPAKIRVVPCSTDTKMGETAVRSRPLTRRRLGLEGQFVVCYCGSMYRWQMANESCRLFKIISTFRNNAHFLGLTADVQELTEAADRAGIDRGRRTIMSTSHSEVAIYLAAADVGLLLREPSIVNRVASPVKFAEYLACNLPVIISSGIGDFSSLVEREKLGVVVSEPISSGKTRQAVGQFLDEFSERTDVGRARCAKIANEQLNWSVSAKVVSELYNQIAT